MVNRCFGTGDELYERYHDNEWGVPVFDDRLLFEMLVLEGAHAGLSWLTVLKKRDSYREAFDNFDVRKVASYTDKKHEQLLQNPGIVRNRLKVLSATKNAKVFIAIQEEFGSFSDYLWSFVNNNPIVNGHRVIEDIPSTSLLSDKISKDLKSRGMSFVGSTIMYAYLQAVGVVNDHVIGCPRHLGVQKFYR
jgi:DNA-3-methyladenine glycosylase I